MRSYRLSETLHCSFAFALSLIFLIRPVGQLPLAEASPKTRRPVTVADTIRMTKLWNNDYFGAATPTQEVAQISPDGSKVLVVVKRGNLEKNTNDYSLLLWQMGDIFNAAVPKALLTMSSSSNREAIKNVMWFEDNKTIAFLGEGPGELAQVYAFDIQARTLRRLTDHPTNVISYCLTAPYSHIAYFAERPKEKIWNEKTRRTGVWIGSHPTLADLILGVKNSYQPELFAFSIKPRGDPKRLPVLLSPAVVMGRIFLSPDGRYIALYDTFTGEVPETWGEYTDPFIQKHLNSHIGNYTYFARYVLIDTRTGRTRTLLNSPVRPEPWGSEAVWSSDSSSLVVTHTYLPLEGTEGPERKERQSVPFAVEIKVPNGEITKISQEDLGFPAWDQKTGQLAFDRKEMNGSEVVRRLLFQKEGSEWRKIGEVPKGERAPEIVLDEDMNTPPRIVVKDPKTQEKTVLLDLNPLFKDLKFGMVKQIEWGTTDGQIEKGRLYYPVDYVPGKRYPLVIQTHAYDQPDKFEIDGPFTTAFAAQPLAGKGIVVLETQIHHSSAEETRREADEARAVFEGAIGYLDQSGLIDLDRIGIIGFSRTCFHVKALLTSSKYHFAAASVSDGLDGGYFQYLVGDTQKEFLEHVNGSAPFGSGLKMWMEHSPGFQIDRVQTPLLITALNPGSLLGEWEWFASLRRLGKPVEMVYLEDGSHTLERPWDRMVSQQGNLDWFAFWLKGEEDADPARAEQYARWRELRGDKE